MLDPDTVFFVERDFHGLTDVVLYCLFIELFVDSNQQCYKDLGFRRYNNILQVPCLCRRPGYVMFLVLKYRFTFCC